MAKAKYSFRKGGSQAKILASALSAHGESRHEGKAGDMVGLYGIGSERNFKQSVKGCADWLRSEKRGDLWTATRQALIDYLEQRGESVRQSALDLDRQSLDKLQRHLHGAGTEPLPKIRAELETIKSTRSYTPAQLAAIRSHQGERHALMTELAEKCGGLRAHEGATIRLASEGEQPRSAHREWDSRRFDGPDGKRPDGVMYTVKGKGGLIREIWVERRLANLLEYRRLDTPKHVVDRGIKYVKYYDLGTGQAWSQSFSSASKRALGWSNGAHGVRHTYVKATLAALQSYGYSYHVARRLVSQTVGHFRESVIDSYLR